MRRVQSVAGLAILDSRGNPTVAAASAEAATRRRPFYRNVAALAGTHGAPRFAEALRWAVEIDHALGRLRRLSLLATA
jgi:hypothetical protein